MREELARADLQDEICWALGIVCDDVTISAQGVGRVIVQVLMTGTELVVVVWIEPIATDELPNWQD